jgi:FAD dependent oxidoreductase TIGR03364
VLQQFASGEMLRDGFELLEAGEIGRRFPAANLEGLRGGLFSAGEAVVQPATAMEALTKLTAERGAELHFGTAVARVTDDAVETSEGRRFEFDQLVIAAGDDMRTLFPAELAAAQLRRCRLQMMRTCAQPAGFELGAIFVSDLTLCHYPAFRACASVGKLRERLEAELPEHHKWGVHVIAAQHPDGSLVVGDSHEYGADFGPESRTEVDALILGELRKFARIPRLEVAGRWFGFYLRSAVGQTQVVLRPRENVTMVTAMGGIGMTLSWGLADRVVRGWKE